MHILLVLDNQILIFDQYIKKIYFVLPFYLKGFKLIYFINQAINRLLRILNILKNLKIHYP